MLWCPKCHYRTVLAKFFSDQCPQCGTVVEAKDALRSDPYSPQQGNRQKKHEPIGKKFSFDQKGGSDTDAVPGNIPSIPTETLGMYATKK